jgi:hypothetical protein
VCARGERVRGGCGLCCRAIWRTAPTRKLQAGYYRLKIGKIAQFEDPSIAVAFDVDQKAAAATRQKAFADAAKGGYFVAFDHMYFPGVGRIKKESVGYRWLPIPYINDSPRS